MTTYRLGAPVEIKGNEGQEQFGWIIAQPDSESNFPDNPFLMIPTRNPSTGAITWASNNIWSYDPELSDVQTWRYFAFNGELSGAVTVTGE